MELCWASNIFAGCQNDMSTFGGLLEIFGLELNVLWIKTE